MLLDQYGKPWAASYDAITDRKRRRPPLVALQSEDKELTTTDRKKLLATSRDIVRNFTIAAWMIRKHLDYVSTFEFQPRSGCPVVDGRLRELMDFWGQKLNFDIAGRHSMSRFMRLAEARRTIDGDFFVLKLSSGWVQGIEGDRIRTPHTELPANVDSADVTEGIWLTPAGRPRGYCVHDRSGGRSFTFRKIIPAKYILEHGYYDRIDQVRGIGLVAPGLNILRDTYESIDYAVAKAKVAQIFGVVLKRNAEESAGDVESTADGEGNVYRAETVTNLGKGPFLLDLEPDEAVEVVESRVPAQEFQTFVQMLIMISLKAVDIPYGHFDESFTNYSGNRQAWILYDQSAEIKRRDNRELLDHLTRWRLMLWLIDGDLVLPKSVSSRDIHWEWLSRGIPWIDPLKEVTAEGEALDRALTSRQRILRRQGQDFHKIADELAEETEYLKSKGLAGNSQSEAKFTYALSD